MLTPNTAATACLNPPALTSGILLLIDAQETVIA